MELILPEEFHDTNSEEEITFNFEDISIQFDNEEQIKACLKNLILNEGKFPGTINYVFCTDEYLLNINQEYLNHNTLTDIISFQYQIDPIAGDIFISVERVKENASTYGVSFKEELYRVLSHGLLHFCGYKDKTKKDQEIMRGKEDYYVNQILSSSAQ